MQHEEEEALKAVWARLNVDGPFSTGAAVALLAGWAHDGDKRNFWDYSQHGAFYFFLGALAGVLEHADTELVYNFVVDLAEVPVARRNQALQSVIDAIRAEKEAA